MKQHIHAVRLRGPWQYKILAPNHRDLPNDSQQQPTEGKITLPTDVRKLSYPCQNTSIKLTRIFHCPTGLTSIDQLWLTFENCKTTAKVDLNDQTIGQLQPELEFTEIHLTEPLQATNLLSLEFELESPTDQSSEKFTEAEPEESVQLYPVSEVRLEIRS